MVSWLCSLPVPLLVASWPAPLQTALLRPPLAEILPSPSWLEVGQSCSWRRWAPSRILSPLVRSLGHHPWTPAFPALVLPDLPAMS